MHSQEALARFQQGETRLVFARYRAEPARELFYLADGQAGSAREFTRAQLECFMPECRNRRLAAVSRRKGRDGFRHMSGAGGHADESLFHAQAKELIRRWALRVDPAAQADVEEATESRKRRADVLIHWSSSSLPTTAVEVQYSQLSVDAWQARHDSYVEQGLVDLWLFGHTGPHFKTSYSAGGPSRHADLRLSPVHQAVAGAGLPLLWINPIAALVGVASVSLDSYECSMHGCTHPRLVPPRLVPPRKHDSAALFSVDSLDDCSPDPLGMTSPSLARYRGERKSLEREAAVFHEGRRREREVAERSSAEDRRLQAWHAANREHLEERWLKSTLRRQMVQEHEGTFPVGLAYRHRSQNGIYAIPEAWHSLIYRDHIMNKPRGHRFTVDDCYDTLAQDGVEMHEDSKRRSAAIIDFLKDLRRLGILSFQFEGGGNGDVVVRATFKELQLQQDSEAAVTNGSDTNQRCKRCGLRLDAILARHGYHVGC